MSKENKLYNFIPARIVAPSDSYLPTISRSNLSTVVTSTADDLGSLFDYNAPPPSYDDAIILKGRAISSSRHRLNDLTRKSGESRLSNIFIQKYDLVLFI